VAQTGQLLKFVHAQFWLNLQTAYDLRVLERSGQPKKAIREIEPRRAEIPYATCNQVTAPDEPLGAVSHVIRGVGETPHARTHR
jgi:hypothetical protein